MDASFIYVGLLALFLGIAQAQAQAQEGSQGQTQPRLEQRGQTNQRALRQGEGAQGQTPIRGRGLTAAVHALGDPGQGENLGQFTLYDSPYGVYVEPQLAGLPPGYHGIELRRGADCAASVRAEALRPRNPNATRPVSEFRSGQGQQTQGRLDQQLQTDDFIRPTLFVDQNGEANAPFMLPRGFRLSEVTNHSLVILAEGADSPVACAVLRRDTAPRASQPSPRRQP